MGNGPWKNSLTTVVPLLSLIDSALLLESMLPLLRLLELTQVQLLSTTRLLHQRTSQCQLRKSSPDRLSRLLLELLNLVLQFLVPVMVVRYLLRMVLLLLQASPRSSLFKLIPIKEVELTTSGLSHSYGRQLRLLLLTLHQR